MVSSHSFFQRCKSFHPLYQRGGLKPSIAWKHHGSESYRSTRLLLTAVFAMLNSFRKGPPTLETIYSEDSNIFVMIITSQVGIVRGSPQEKNKTIKHMGHYKIKPKDCSLANHHQNCWKKDILQVTIVWSSFNMTIWQFMAHATKKTANMVVTRWL